MDRELLVLGVCFIRLKFFKFDITMAFLFLRPHPALDLSLLYALRDLFLNPLNDRRPQELLRAIHLIMSSSGNTAPDLFFQSYTFFGELTS